MNPYGYVKVGCTSPKIKVSDVIYNEGEIVKIIKENENLGTKILLFPALTLTGATCGDLFFNQQLLDRVNQSLFQILEATKDIDMVSIIGLPLLIQNGLYNVATVIQKGTILGIVPDIKTTRQFLNGKDLNTVILLNNQEIPVSSDLLFENKDLIFGVSMDNDLSMTSYQSEELIKKGANTIFQMGSSKMTVGSYQKRKEQVKVLSSQFNCAYIDVSSNTSESSDHAVYQGQLIIYENGQLLSEGKRYLNDSQMIISDVDIKMINYQRRKKNMIFEQNETISFTIGESNKIERQYGQYPFITKNQEALEEILQMQATGLVKRMESTNINKTIIGISGGLDSTLALLVMLRAYDILSLDRKNIIAVTMPGFGTSKKTLESAKKLMQESGVTSREISIKESCLLHLQDIGHDMNNKDTTYENAQARERTQILMDLGNQENAFVIGTGDLSELALGYCTFNGDHMSMYSLNASIAKTLVKELVKFEADRGVYKEVLYAILETPISPELLPTNELGNISQKSEDNIGPYLLQDFFLYHFLQDGWEYEKLLEVTSLTFQEQFTKEEIKKWLDILMKRFFQQQFKRNCMPDGVNIGINLSPADYQMPSDSSGI